jgi:hypothetical protein
MKLLKLGATLLAILALGSVAASGAMAENLYEDTESAWYTGTSPGTKLTGTKVLKASANTAITLSTTVAEIPVKYQATGIECVSCTIENSGSRALAHGKLKFTGLTVVEPASCSTPSSSETTALTMKVGMEKGSSTVAAIEATPTSGTTLSTMELTGASCALAGAYKLSGKVDSEMHSVTGTFLEKHLATWSKAIQEKFAQLNSLKFGTSVATPEGTVSWSVEMGFAVKPK